MACIDFPPNEVYTGSHCKLLWIRDAMSLLCALKHPLRMWCTYRRWWCIVWGRILSLVSTITWWGYDGYLVSEWEHFAMSRIKLDMIARWSLFHCTFIAYVDTFIGLQPIIIGCMQFRSTQLLYLLCLDTSCLYYYLTSYLYQLCGMGAPFT